MPLYEYACTKCKKHFEVMQNIGSAPAKCPDCGSDCQKLVSATSFQLKGSGWYKTDYSSPSSGGASKSTHSSACACCPKTGNGTCGA